MELEFKGTKGGWIAFNNGLYWEVTSKEYDVKNVNNFSIFKNVLIDEKKTIYKSINDEEVKANAKLIASAPDLLEALKELLTHALENDLHSVFTDNAKKAIEKALK